MRTVRVGSIKLPLSKNEASNFNRLLALSLPERQTQFDLWFNAVPKTSEAQERRRAAGTALNLEIPA